MIAIISNPRGVRAAWDDGLLDALMLSVATLGDCGRLTDADRALIVVKALKMWPDHAITTMVDRTLLVEDTIAAAGAAVFLSDRDRDTLLVDALFRPVLLASTLRPLDAAEKKRLARAVRATGVEPSTFGLPE